MEIESSSLEYVVGKEEFTTIASVPNKTNVSGLCANSVHDIELSKTHRLVVLYATIGSSVIGTILVVLWMICNKRLSKKFNHLSRVNAFILNLTLADILVILLAVLPQLVWEYVDREWFAGAFMCRLVKFIQTFSMMSSNYMLVVIAIDRHQAIRSPLKETVAVWKLAGSGWALSAILSFPVMGVFHTNVVDGRMMCENIFRYRPQWHRQIWMTWVFVVVFFVPLVILIICYTRIFMKIARKANRNSVKYKPGKVCLQSTHSNSLPKAKLKTLKMTFVIVLTFIISTAPYFVIEMIMSYGDHCIISKKLYAIFGGMAACNSATNPYVFLIFNVKISWLKELFKRENDSPKRGHFSYTNSTGGNFPHHITLTTCKGNCLTTKSFCRGDTEEHQSNDEGFR